MRHLEDNLGAVGWTLAEDQMDRLSEASQPETPYPYDFIRGAQEGR